MVCHNRKFSPSSKTAKGYMWFGTNSGGAGKFDGNKFSSLTKNDGLIDDVVFSIAENENKELLFGTSKGLSIYKPHKL